MNGTARTSLRGRMLLLSLLSAGVALVLALAGLGAREYLASRGDLEERLAVLARIIAENGAPALAFADERAAADVLATLRSAPHVTEARLFGRDGEVFAQYRGAHAGSALGSVTARREVRLGSDRLGELVIVADLHELEARLAGYAVVALLTLVAALAASALIHAAMRGRVAHAEEALAELNRTLEEKVRSRTAELERAVSELEAFSYSVSHDLRAPARAMAGFAGILREDHGAALPPEALRALKRIEDSATHMGRLTDDLLEFSRTGRTPLTLAPVDMRALAASVAQELAGPEASPVRIGRVPPARGDAALLRQVWRNLIGNALKFSREARPPVIEIGGERRGAAVEYFVRDNGAGFDMKYAGKLFGVFERLHSPEEYEGTGVGLAIVQRIVQRHGGRVSAEGAPGQGATFRFTLPA